MLMLAPVFPAPASVPVRMFISFLSSSLCATVGAPIPEASALAISLSPGSAGSQGGISSSVVIIF